jgi:HEAT repeat protein
MVRADEVDELIKQLHDKNANVRRKAAIALGMIGDARAIEALIKGLDNEDEVL